MVTDPTLAMVILYGPVPPVITILRLAELPEHIEAVPDKIAEVIPELTVTVAPEPIMTPEHAVASVAAVIM